MFISLWQFYLLMACICVALILQAHSLYIINEARNLRKGVTSSVIGRAIINLVVAVCINGYILYSILMRK